jgi:hypothetical protein
VEKAFNQLTAYIYLEKSDRSKYGSLLAGLQTQQSFKNNQYPQNLIEANNVLSNHRLDNAKKNGYKASGKGSEKKKNQEEEKVELLFAMLEGKRYCCGKGGHKSPNCRLEDVIPKNEWAINKARQQSQVNSTVNPETSTASQETTTASSQSSNREWSGAHIQMYQADVMREIILAQQFIYSVIQI